MTDIGRILDNPDLADFVMCQVIAEALLDFEPSRYGETVRDGTWHYGDPRPRLYVCVDAPNLRRNTIRVLGIGTPSEGWDTLLHRAHTLIDYFMSTGRFPCGAQP